MKKLKQQFEFISELDKLKAIYRQTYVKSDNNRNENSAEHSWHVALMAQVLSSYVDDSFEGEVDINRVMQMLLIHDIVEIDAGDMFAFAEQSEHDAQEEKELLALKRIFGLLGGEQGENFKKLWLEFEAAKTADARFAKAMDRMLPLLQNMENQGGSWVKHKVNKSQVLVRNQYLEHLTPKLWQYACGQIDLAVENGWLIDK